MSRARRVGAEQGLLFGASEPPRYPSYCRVALNRVLRQELTYGIPNEWHGRVAPGCRVAVPFRGGRPEVGVVVGVEDETDVDPGRVRGILRVLDSEPLVGRDLLEVTRWMARRFGCSWGEALGAVLPASLKSERGRRQVRRVRASEGVGRTQLEELEALGKPGEKQLRLLRELVEIDGAIELRVVLRRLRLSESPVRSLQNRGWIEVESVEAVSDSLMGSIDTRPPPSRLSSEQEAAVDAIRGAIETGRPQTFLLFGVTGSGKTEVYLRAIQHALERGKGAIVLVPEIALTPQTVGRFRGRFGEVCVLHSGMTDAQRTSEWMRLRRGEVRVVVGARSAVFAPVQDLGVLVIDEEHEPSFKQENAPRYHARDVAIERARRAGAACVLGTATPSLETWEAASSGRVRLLRLSNRVGGGAPPQIHVVDMRLEPGRRPDAPFTRLLHTFLEETLDAGEQAILFLNRRGFVPVLHCRGCDETVRCEHCSLALTYHRRIARLVCHGCCEERDLPRVCPVCTRPGLTRLGLGTERVEAELAALFPSARVGRMDSDTMRRRQDYERVLGAFERHELDVLVGTQMIAKGLDFPRVTLVGILSADQTLALPDYRATERAYQLIAQVSGRAGRAHLPGRIVIQTHDPANRAIRHALSQDYEAFAAEELRDRRMLAYPPYTREIRVLAEGGAEAEVLGALRPIHDRIAAEWGRRLRVLTDPVPAPISLLRGRYRYNFYLRLDPDFPDHSDLVAFLTSLAPSKRGLQLKIDVDPISAA